MEMGLIFPNLNNRVTTEGGTQAIGAASRWMDVGLGRERGRQIRLSHARDRLGREAFTGQSNCFEGLPRKSSKGVFIQTVSQSDTGRQGE
jgi:hypothetical protein